MKKKKANVLVLCMLIPTLFTGMACATNNFNEGCTLATQCIINIFILKLTVKRLLSFFPLHFQKYFAEFPLDLILKNLNKSVS